MSQSQNPSALPTLITFLVGAAIGAVAVALATPRSGARLRQHLKALACSGRRRAHLAAEHFRGHGLRTRQACIWHSPGARGDHAVSVNDLLG